MTEDLVKVNKIDFRFETDDTVMFRLNVSNNNQCIGNIFMYVDKDEYKESLKFLTYEQACKQMLKDNIQDNPNYLSKLPRISVCSKLLQKIYDKVCNNNGYIYIVREVEWKKFYLYEYSEDDFKELQNEIDKYGLKKYIKFDKDDEFKIFAYSSLLIKFIDDRKMDRTIER